MERPLPVPPGTAGVAVGFSGGLDSSVLLHRLAASPRLRARGLRALHVDHGLHADSARWAAACASTCAAWDVPLEVRRVHVAAAGDGLEGAARAARYAAFAAMQRPGEVIALAHHRDDQAETVLLRLLRGAGGDGLAAMRESRRFGDGWLWRPLLAHPRSELVAYARAQGLAWVDDPSNASSGPDRNFLRHEVMPRLAQRWPSAAAGLARSAALLAAQAGLLAGEDARRLAALRHGDPGSLDLDGLRAQPDGWRDRLLRAWIAGLGLPAIPGPALAAIDRELLASATGGGLVAWPGAEVRAWRGRLWAGAPAPVLPSGWQAGWDGRTPLLLPTGGVLELQPPAAFPAPLVVRARRGGERITLPGRGHSHALKHVLQERAVPPWRRPALPLLESADGEVLAAGDAVVSARLQCWLDRDGIRLHLRAGPRR